MKVTTLILSVVCAASFSSCCCQSQPMPKLRPMPGDCGTTTTTPQQPGDGQQVIKVWRTKGGK